MSHPKANPDCKACGGYGYLTIGSMCSGFGGERYRNTYQCNCTLAHFVKKRYDDEFIGFGLE